jgi:integrase/recombinase XerD
MNRTTDLALHLTAFLSRYLPGERGMSIHTISSYRYTFILFLNFMEQRKKTEATKLELAHITKETVVEFLDWLQSERKCTARGITFILPLPAVPAPRQDG